MDFAQVYQQNSLDVFRYCMFHLRNKEIAEDATSESFARFMQNSRSTKLGEAEIKPWLFGIARNVVRENYSHTKAKSNVSLDSDLIPSSNKDTETIAIDTQLISIVSQELDKLPELTREIIILKIWEDFSFKEISKITSKSESNCKLTYYRALEQIKLQLGEREPSKKLYSVSGLIIPAILQLKQLPSMQLDPAWQAQIPERQFNYYSQNMQQNTVKNLLKRKLFIFAAISTVLVVAIVSIISLVIISNSADQAPILQPQAQQPNNDLPVEPILIPMEPEEEETADLYAGWTKIDTNLAYTWDYGANPVWENLNLKFYFPEAAEITTPSTGGGYEIAASGANYVVSFLLRLETYENVYTSPELIGVNNQFGSIYNLGLEDNAYLYTNSFAATGTCAARPGETVSAPCGFGTIMFNEHSLQVSCTGPDKAVCDKIVLSLTAQDI